MKKTAPTSTSPAAPPKSRRRPKADTPAAPSPRKKMPAEVFVGIWKEGPFGLGELETEWEDLVKLKGSSTIQFSNIEVLEDIHVGRTDYPWSNLVLSNCQLHNCFFRNAKIQSISIIENTTTGDFSILQGSTTGKLEIINSTTGSFQIIDSVVGNFEIRSIPARFPQVQMNSETKNFKLENSKLGNIEIAKDSKIGAFNIKGSEAKDIRIENSKIGAFWVHEDSKIGTFHIGAVSAAQHFRIENSKVKAVWFSDEAMFSDLHIIESILTFLLVQNSTGSKVYIRNSTLDDVNIYTSCVLNFNLFQSVIPNIQVVEKSFIGHFQCHLPLQTPAQITLIDSKIRHLDLDNSVLPEFATMMVSACEINLLSLKDFCSYGTVFFAHLQNLDEWKDFDLYGNGNPIRSEDRQYKFVIKKPNPPNSTLRLTDSDLGKMQFINCDLRQFQRFEFSNTKMLDVFVAGSQMPGDKAFCMPNDEQNPSKLAEQKRLAFGQFKKIYEARGDVAGSLRYLSYEMRAYRAMLSNRIKKQQPFSKQWFDYVGELGILWLNQFSTNYGNNWLRGVVVTLFMTVACFSIYCFLLGYRPQPIGGDWGKFGELASHSLAYLNPFRDEDSGQFFETLKDDGLKITWYARFWDYLSRIIIAYFVYQTIQAFRKLGKSSG